METIEFKSIPSDRMEKIKELCNMLSAEDFKIEAEPTIGTMTPITLLFYPFHLPIRQPKLILNI